MTKTKLRKAQRIRVVLADDHVLLRQGLKTLIDATPDVQVVGEAGSGAEAALRAASLLPDVVVMDVSMPDGNGIRATAQIRTECPTVRVLGLSRHVDPGYVRRLLQAGASGYLVKRTTAVHLMKAIRAVAAGQTFLDEAVVPLMAEKRRDHLRGAVGGMGLSPREGDVLRLIARGRSNRDIAEALDISVKTVEYHKARCAEKLGLESRADIVRYAISEGWLEE